MQQDNERRQEAYALVRQGLTLAQVAEVLGEPLGTISRWSAAERWQEKVAEERLYERVRVVRSIQNFLANEVVHSLETMRDIRDDTKIPANTRLSAANSILKIIPDLRAFTSAYADIMERSIEGVPEIERHVNLGKLKLDLEQMTAEELEDQQRKRIWGNA